MRRCTRERERQRERVRRGERNVKEERKGNVEQLNSESRRSRSANELPDFPWNYVPRPSSTRARSLARSFTGARRRQRRSQGKLAVSSRGAASCRYTSPKMTKSVPISERPSLIDECGSSFRRNHRSIITLENLENLENRARA